MVIPYTTRNLIIGRAVAHSLTACPFVIALAAEEGVWQQHRGRKLTAEQRLDLVLDEIEALS